jgi:hypothetical protein
VLTWIFLLQEVVDWNAGALVCRMAASRWSILLLVRLLSDGFIVPLAAGQVDLAPHGTLTFD